MVIFHSYVSLPKGSSFFFHSFFSRFPQNKFINDAGDQPESSTHPAFFRSCECCSSTKRAEYGRMNQFSQFSFGPLGRRSCLSRNILLSYTIIIYLYITSIMNYHIYIYNTLKYSYPSCLSMFGQSLDIVTVKIRISRHATLNSDETDETLDGAGSNSWICRRNTGCLPTLPCHSIVPGRHETYRQSTRKVGKWSVNDGSKHGLCMDSSMDSSLLFEPTMPLWQKRQGINRLVNG